MTEPPCLPVAPVIRNEIDILSKIYVCSRLWV